MASKVESFTIADSIIRRHHIYRDACLSRIGKVLSCFCDEGAGEGSFEVQTRHYREAEKFTLLKYLKRDIYRLNKAQDTGL